MGRQIIAALATALVCLLPQAYSTNIIGVDDRRLVDSQRTKPFTTIVRVHANLPNRSNFGTCSGALVDRRIVLTAAHCVDDIFPRDANGQRQWVSGARIEVFAGIRRNNGRSEFERRSTVRSVRWGSFTERKRDWALLLLDEPLGERFGWLGVLGQVRASDINSGGRYRNLIMGSVPGDKDSLVYGEYGCKFRRARTIGYFDNGSPREELELIEHDCDVVRGSSGGPIIFRNSEGNHFVAGLHVSSVTAPNQSASEGQFDRYPNLAVPPQTFIRQLREWKERYP